MEEMNPSDALAGQAEIDKFFSEIPQRMDEALVTLREKIPLMKSFDLLANLSLYNNLQDEQYTDHRGDRMYTVSELVALLCLQQDYIPSSQLPLDQIGIYIQEMQELGSKYFHWATFRQMRETVSTSDHTFEGITFKNARSETTIRNPGVPYHHFEIVKELYKPIADALKKQFGFTAEDSILLRDGIVKVINHQINHSKRLLDPAALETAMYVYKFRATGTVPENCPIDENQLKELNKLSRKQIYEACLNYHKGLYFYGLSQYFTFTAESLSQSAGLDIPSVSSFLNTFSCRFNSLPKDDEVVSTNHILKRKPIIEHNGRYLLPSVPLLTWCVEPEIEDFIKKNSKLQGRFTSAKHDYLLNTGIGLLAKVLGKTDFCYTNLFYLEQDGDPSTKCETDGIIIAQRTLFIIEAKGNRISQPAKDGKIERMERHLDDLIENSYLQGIRTEKYLSNKRTATFYNEKKQKIEVDISGVDNIVITSLILEPIGNITPLIRATNELKYFTDSKFPWIVSIYDLMIVADHLPSPLLLVHYIKRRQEFLSKEIMSIYDEVDLIGYYLYNCLFIEDIYNDARSKQVNYVQLDILSDPINNYYVEKKRGSADLEKHKVKSELPGVILLLIDALSEKDSRESKAAAMHILDYPKHVIEKLAQNIEKAKRNFTKHKALFKCSIAYHVWGKVIGVTFYSAHQGMMNVDRLSDYCRSKFLEVSAAEIWVGISDSSIDAAVCDLDTVVIVKR